MEIPAFYPKGDPQATRDSLLSRLHNWDDQESWKDFFEIYWRLIYSVAIKAGLTETEAEDVVQETVISVAKSIHRFKRESTNSSFRGWLRTITQHRAVDQFRKRRRQEGHPGKLDITQIADPSIPSIETLWDEEWESNLFHAALQRVKSQLKAEHFQIFTFNVLKNQSANKVGEMFGITTAQVYVIKHRVSALVKKEIRALEKKTF
jgi:RNA polymerase sigma factor (sigma-70 family)